MEQKAPASPSMSAYNKSQGKYNTFDWNNIDDADVIELSKVLFRKDPETG